MAVTMVKHTERSHLGLGARRLVRRHTDVTVRMLGLSFWFCRPGTCCLTQCAEAGRFLTPAGGDAALMGGSGPTTLDGSSVLQKGAPCRTAGCTVCAARPTRRVTRGTRDEAAGGTEPGKAALCVHRW